MKKTIVATSIGLLLLTTSICYCATKYKVNTSGVIKTQTGNIISSPSNTINQHYLQNQTMQQLPFNTYSASNYVSQEQVNRTQVSIIEFVMDYSGSMSNWIVIAKRSMASILNQIPYNTTIGFRVFGHDNGNNPTTINTVQDVKKIVKQGSKFKVITERSPLGSRSGICSSTQLVSPLIPANTSSILSGMNSVSLGGATPLVYALDRAAFQDFAYLDTITPKKIILITDGGENCGGDPCAFANNLMKKRTDIHIDVVLVSSSSKSLSCLATKTGGHFYNINDLSNFSTTITDSMLSNPTSQPQKNQKYEFIND